MLNSSLNIKLIYNYYLIVDTYSDWQDDKNIDIENQ